MRRVRARSRRFRAQEIIQRASRVDVEQRVARASQRVKLLLRPLALRRRPLIGVAFQREFSERLRVFARVVVVVVVSRRFECECECEIVESRASRRPARRASRASRARRTFLIVASLGASSNASPSAAYAFSSTSAMTHRASRSRARRTPRRAPRSSRRAPRRARALDVRVADAARRRVRARARTDKRRGLSRRDASRARRRARLVRGETGAARQVLRGKGQVHQGRPRAGEQDGSRRLVHRRVRGRGERLVVVPGRVGGDERGQGAGEGEGEAARNEGSAAAEGLRGNGGRIPGRRDRG